MKKFNSRYEILTPSGFSEFDGVMKSVKEYYYKIQFTNGSVITCTEDHMFKTDKGFVKSQHLVSGSKLISKSGYYFVSSIVKINERKEFYDALEVKSEHEYYTQSVVSHNCEFMGSSGTLIRGNKLKQLVSRTPIRIALDGKLKQYEEPCETKSYVMVCDVSRGKGLDYSAFSVFDVSEMPYKQVATYKNNLIIPPDYADIIYRVGKMYNECSILVEINDIGGQVSDILYGDYEYENLIATENGGRAGKRVSTGFGAASKTVDLGIRTSKASKAAGCSMAKILIEGDQLIVNDQDTIAELMRFSKKGNSYEAEDGCHDDMVMGIVLFGWLADQPYFKELTDVNLMEELRERTKEEVMEDLAPFGIVNDGLDAYEPNKVSLTGQDWF